VNVELVIVFPFGGEPIPHSYEDYEELLQRSDDNPIYADLDEDGWPDLYVASDSTSAILYHNNHDGTFTDVTASAGMSREFGPALGVSTADFNGDGWIDIFVANDGQPNQLWINQHDGTFRNTALLSGVALGPEGQAKSSMGIDAGDFDNDGDEDLFITELTGQGDGTTPAALRNFVLLFHSA
jgi:hypothetical protein